MYRLNYTEDNQYLDANDVTISTENFGSILSVADFSDIIDDPTTSLVEYFVDRGYTVDVNLRAAPYDWRLAAGNIRVAYACMKSASHISTYFYPARMRKG